MKTVLIGTTSINRSLLHKDNIPDWYNYIHGLDKSKYNIRWFINVDYIEKLEESVQETMENYRNIITDIPIVFIQKKEQDGNFLENEKIFFYEIANNTLNTDNFGLNTLSYDLHKTENIKNNVYFHSIKI